MNAQTRNHVIQPDMFGQVSLTAFGCLSSIDKYCRVLLVVVGDDNTNCESVISSKLGPETSACDSGPLTIGSNCRTVLQRETAARVRQGWQSCAHDYALYVDPRPAVHGAPTLKFGACDSLPCCLPPTFPRRSAFSVSAFSSSHHQASRSSSLLSRLTTQRS
jgi:hypothetical protein